MSTDGVVRVVQFPHPGDEHVPNSDGRRPWPCGEASHRRTFLASPGTFRQRLDAPDEEGDLQFWGEWEGEAIVERDLGDKRTFPRWLCRPNPNGTPPMDCTDGAPPQNTDPFVWGDAIRYSYCRQLSNRKLRELARGSLVLFGSGLGGEFILDTVLVVAEVVPFSRDDYRELATSREHMRATIEPAYGWKAKPNERPLRMYVGATTENAIEGMFSFVPCLPADADGFKRPAIRLPGYVNPRNWRQVGCTAVGGIGEVAEIWHDVVHQVSDAGLALASRLILA